MELSIRAYARHRNITEGAVRKALKTGRISKTKNGKIDPGKADKQWQQNSDPAQTKTIGNDPVTGPTYQQSRTVKEAYEARLKKLDYDLKVKKLIPADQVRVSAFNCARMTRDRILNIPDRVIPMLVGKTDIHQMKEILRTELTKALEELSNSNES